MMHQFRASARIALCGGVSAAAMAVASPALAVDLSFMISDVDAKASLVTEFAERYKEQNPDVNIELNVVGYNVIREQLPIQLEAGTGPDLAFVTNLGGLNPYYVDLAPYGNVREWLGRIENLPGFVPMQSTAAGLRAA